MAEFISTFITGFQEVVESDLTKRFPKIKILGLYDGLVHYRFDGDSRELEKIIYFNNTFFVLKTMKGKGLNFNSLVGAVTSLKNYSRRLNFQNVRKQRNLTNVRRSNFKERIVANLKRQSLLVSMTNLWAA